MIKALRPKRTLVTRKGKTFMTTVYVGSNKSEKARQAKNKAVQPRQSDKKRKSRETTQLMEDQRRVIDFAPNDKLAVDKVLSFQQEYYKDHEKPSMYETIEAATQEVEYALENVEDSGADWYQESMEKCRSILAEQYPDLAGDTDWDFFLTPLSILSAGIAPKDNLKACLAMYDHYKKTGEISTVHPETGQSYTAKSSTERMDKFKKVYEQFDSKEDFVEFLNGVSTVGDLKEKFGKDVTGYGVNLSGDKDEMAFNSMIFGEKVGQFYQSLRGTEGSVATDRWAIRSFYRWTGQLSEGTEKDYYTGGQSRVVSDDVKADDRKAFEYVAQTVGDRLGLESYQMQAVMWYYEKRLYQKLGIPKTGEQADFGDAAEELFKKSMGDVDLQEQLRALIRDGKMPQFNEVLQAVMAVKR